MEQEKRNLLEEIITQPGATEAKIFKAIPQDRRLEYCMLKIRALRQNQENQRAKENPEPKI